MTRQSIFPKHLNRLIRPLATALLTAAVISAPAHAYDGQVNGVPGLIEVTNGSNYGFRVSLGTVMCTNGSGFAYLNEADSNYKTYVALVLMAKAQSLAITVFSNRDSSGYCHIEDIQMT